MIITKNIYLFTQSILNSQVASKTIHAPINSRNTASYIQGEEPKKHNNFICEVRHGKLGGERGCLVTLSSPQSLMYTVLSGRFHIARAV
jgi:hypothetical protein